MELSSEEMDGRAQVFVTVRAEDLKGAFEVLSKKYPSVRIEGDTIRVYDVFDSASIVDCLMKNGHVPSFVEKNKIGLEEYYVELMSSKEEK